MHWGWILIFPFTPCSSERVGRETKAVILDHEPSPYMLFHTWHFYLGLLKLDLWITHCSFILISGCLSSAGCLCFFLIKKYMLLKFPSFAACWAFLSISLLLWNTAASLRCSVAMCSCSCYCPQVCAPSKVDASCADGTQLECALEDGRPALRTIDGPSTV